jgi:hypothetical protein
MCERYIIAYANNDEYTFDSYEQFLFLSKIHPSVIISHAMVDIDLIGWCPLTGVYPC